MKELTKKQKHTCSIYKQFNKTAKEIFICLLYIFIFVSCYYVCMRTYSFNINNCELVTVYNTNCVELEPTDYNQSNIWCKSILDDFFKKFTSNSKTINPKFLEIKSNCAVKTLYFEYNLETGKKSVMLNKILSDSTKSIISEYEFYKNKASLLETQLLKAKISYQDLIRDINDIVKEINDSFKKS
jgi:hypothetical protein